VLVTGAAGFIGSAVCSLLLDRGHAVVGADSVNDAYDPRLKEWRLARLCGHDRFRFVRADIADADSVRTIFDQGPFEAVINLAARAGVRQSVEQPAEYLHTNVDGVLRLLEACRERGVRKFVQASTSSVYGDSPMPFREDAPAARPLSPYAASKRAAEMLAYSYHRLHGLDVSLLRYFTVFGPAGRPDMSAFRFIRWISEGEPVTLFGDGEQKRDFTFVGDIAEGTVAAMRPLGYEIINLGSDRPVTVNSVIGIIEELTGRSAVVRRQPADPADAPATWAAIARANELLGWTPRTSLQGGLRQTVEWYRENLELARSVRL